jgi:hypothetical protein
MIKSITGTIENDDLTVCSMWMPPKPDRKESGVFKLMSENPIEWFEKQTTLICWFLDCKKDFCSKSKI